MQGSKKSTQAMSEDTKQTLSYFETLPGGDTHLKTGKQIDHVWRHHAKTWSYISWDT